MLKKTCPLSNTLDSAMEGTDGGSRLAIWAGSANFTQSSRRSLEFSTRLTDAGLLTAARSFLLKLVTNSEPLRNEADSMEPEFAPVEYDDATFIDYLREIGPWPEDHDE